MPAVATVQRRPAGILSFFLSLMKLCRDSPSALLVCRLMNMIPQGFLEQHHERVGTERHRGCKNHFPRAGRVRDVIPAAIFCTLHCRTHVAQTLLHVTEELVLCCAL